ncbi:ribonuclease H-like domain-containing protein [Tanacetum coccineum]|uniref:Ribonuclease H-like domain-containing protein n=1 Tax=Tanacetum coccineum TaxID=301880 RepID=A0ABQ5FBJ2_9ASTR
MAEIGPLVSKKGRSALSRSSAEVEYRGVANVVAETYWLHNLLREFHSPLSSATLVYCDNVSSVYLSCNPVQQQRTNHIEIDINFVRELVAAGTDNQEKNEKQSQNNKTGLGMEKTVKDKAKSKPESQSSQKVNRKVNWSKSKSTQVNPGAKVKEI